MFKWDRWFTVEPTQNRRPSQPQGAHFPRRGIWIQAEDVWSNPIRTTTMSPLIFGTCKPTVRMMRECRGVWRDSVVRPVGDWRREGSDLQRFGEISGQKASVVTQIDNMTAKLPRRIPGIKGIPTTWRFPNINMKLIPQGERIRTM